MPRLWIAHLSISDRTHAKVASKHGVDVAELRAQLVGVAGLPFRADEHPDRGLRFVLTLRLGGRDVAVILYPAPDLGDDAFRLGSAYPL